MSTVPSYFKDFLSNIRLSDNQVKDLKTGHTTLRRRLEEDETLSKIIISTFLQGSYRRSTAVKPKNGNKSDVDVIVVTKLDSEEFTPEEALDLFVPFLEKHYKDKYRIQGRSIGISLSYVDLDIVPTSAPGESETGVLQDEAIISEYTIEDFQQKLLEEYSDFYDTVCDAAKIAREAFDCEELYDSVCKWRELFGNEFPPAPKPLKSNSSTGFTTRTEKSVAIPEGRFA